jgi:hypothetical protein
MAFGILCVFFSDPIHLCHAGDHVIAVFGSTSIIKSFLPDRSGDLYVSHCVCTPVLHVQERGSESERERERERKKKEREKETQSILVQRAWPRGLEKYGTD